MKLNKIFLINVDFIGLALFLVLVGGCFAFRICFPMYSGMIDVLLQIIIYLMIIFFCFCNLFVVAPWKEYLWSITFVLGLVLSLLVTGEFNQYTVFFVWSVLAGVICFSDYLSESYKGCVPKKK